MAQRVLAVRFRDGLPPDRAVLHHLVRSHPPEYPTQCSGCSSSSGLSGSVVQVRGRVQRCAHALRVQHEVRHRPQDAYVPYADLRLLMPRLIYMSRRCRDRFVWLTQPTAILTVHGPVNVYRNAAGEDEPSPAAGDIGGRRAEDCERPQRAKGPT